MLNTTEVIFGMIALTILLLGAIGYLGIKTLIRLRMPKSESRDDTGQPPGAI
jgi:hypothetical protein